MPKTKEPPFADWYVALGDATFSEFLTVRASSVIFLDGGVFLRDVSGGILFAAPAATVRYVRRLEAGVKGALAAEAARMPDEYPPSVPELKAPPAAPDPAAVEKAVPAPRPRTTRRGK